MSGNNSGDSTRRRLFAHPMLCLAGISPPGHIAVRLTSVPHRPINAQINQHPERLHPLPDLREISVLWGMHAPCLRKIT